MPAHNVVATKVGSVYPNIFIDVGGHLDTQPTTPGAGDNASGSTAIVEIARVLKDYPNRYSIRFINDVGHETCGNCGMAEHVRLLLARGEQIKAGLMMDGIGWSIIPGANNNEVWWNNLAPATERIVDMFGAVRSIYGIDINFLKLHQPYAGGDGQPYLDQGLPAIMSIGGTPYNAPGYHGCADTMAVMDMQNILKTTQQNLAVMLLLDQENESNLPPVAVNDMYSVDAGVTLNVAAPGVLGNDTDSENGPLTAVKVTDPTHGILTLNGNGSFTYAPAANFAGVDSFAYHANDGTANSNTATVTVVVKSTVPPPLPSRFYGEIYFSYNPPSVGDLVQVQIAGVSRVITTAVTSPAVGALAYQIDVPGDIGGSPEKEGGVEGEVITFTINSRVVATSIWHSGTNTRLDFHSSSVALQPGWNLVSFNLRPVSTAITDVLSSLAGHYDLAYAWNAPGQTWLKYDDIAMSGDNLLQLDERQGFWIHITTTAQSLTVYGQVPTTTNLPLVTGWNMVGYPSSVARALPAALSAHGVDNFTLVYSYRASDPDQWKLFDRNGPPFVNDLTELTPGWGYWIQTPITSTWTVTYPAP